MSISLLHYDGSTVTPKDDAIFNDHVLGGESGILEGCEVTHLGTNQLQVAAGRGIIYGRQFVIAQETINAEVSISGTVNGRLLIEIDIEDTEAPVHFVTQAETTLPALTQEDINHDGTVYQMALNTYSVSTTTISALVDVHEDLAAVAPHTHVPDDITSPFVSLPISATASLDWDDVNKVMILNITGYDPVYLAPVIVGTGDDPPAGTYPLYTQYIQTEV